MRAIGNDITELFGYRPDDLSSVARDAFINKVCPFTRKICSKTNHDQSLIYGVCSVSNGKKKGSHDEVIVCPKRLYQKNYSIFDDLVKDVWSSNTELVIGGDLEDLKAGAEAIGNPAVAFGQGSGTEIAVNSN